MHHEVSESRPRQISVPLFTTQSVAAEAVPSQRSDPAAAATTFRIVWNVVKPPLSNSRDRARGRMARRLGAPPPEKV
jgi:hypothetical protein